MAMPARRDKPYELSHNSMMRLRDIDPRLIELVEEILWYIDVSVIEGRRTLERQKELYREGKTKTMNSKHLDGKAVDLYPYPVPRLPNGEIDSNAKAWNTMGEVALKCAGALGLPEIMWGGLWTSFVDKPHFEIEEL